MRKLTIRIAAIAAIVAGAVVPVAGAQAAPASTAPAPAVIAPAEGETTEITHSEEHFPWG